MAPPPDAAQHSPGQRIHLHLLQAPRVIGIDGREHLLARHDAALLALVTLEGPVARRRAATLVWPDEDRRRPLNNLRQRLFRLHRIAGTALVSRGPLLHLAPGVVHDLSDCPWLLQHDPDAAQGDLLSGLEFDDNIDLASWVGSARQRWRAFRADVLMGIAVRLEADQRLAEALRYATRLITEDPLCEQGTRLLMRLHYRRGDRGAAMAEYDRCVTALHRCLGEAPCAQTHELAAAIGREDARMLTALATRPEPRQPGRREAFASLMTACAAMLQSLQAHLGQAGTPSVGSADLRLLCVLTEHPGSTPPALQKLLGRNRHGVLCLLEALQTRGWVTLARQAGPRPMPTVAVTAAGRAAAEQYLRWEAELADAMFSGLDAGSVDEIDRCCNQLLSQLVDGGQAGPRNAAVAYPDTEVGQSGRRTTGSPPPTRPLTAPAGPG